jgi:hypothetical protein
MADRETIIAGDSGGGANVVLAIVLVLVVAFGAYFLFFNRPASTPATVTVDVPAVTVPAPAAPAPAN